MISAIETSLAFVDLCSKVNEEETTASGEMILQLVRANIPQTNPLQNQSRTPQSKRSRALFLA